MASYLALVAVLAVGISSVSADTCDDCKTAYDNAIAAAADNPAKCPGSSAIPELASVLFRQDPGVPADCGKKLIGYTYSTCLLDASGAGCDSMAAKASALRADLNSYSCTALRAPCMCEMAYSAAMKMTSPTTEQKCTAAADYTSCTFGQTDVAQSCTTTTLNSALKYRARVAFSQYCVCSGHAIRFSVATLLFVVLGWFLKN